MQRCLRSHSSSGDCGSEPAAVTKISYQDAFGPLVSGSSKSHLCKISVSGSCGTTCARSLFQDLCVNDPLDHLYQDPLGALVQDLCSRIFWLTVSGSFKILWDNLSKISVSGSLCEAPLDHLYQDPLGALVQDLCSRIFWPTVSGYYRCTCARSLYQDPVGQLVQDLCFRISV